MYCACNVHFLFKVLIAINWFLVMGQYHGVISGKILIFVKVFITNGFGTVLFCSVRSADPECMMTAKL